MKKWQIWVSLLLIGVGGCKEYDLVPRISGTPGGGVLATKVVSVSGDELTFQVNLFAVNHVGNFIENLNPDDFSAIPVSGINISIEDAAYRQQEYAGAYSVGLLFDQSGSIASTDPGDARVDAGKAFVDLMSRKDEMALAQFSGNGNEGAYSLLSPFTNDKGDLKTLIDGFVGNPSGSTPLYGSVYDLISYTSQNGSNKANRAVVAFTDGANTEPFDYWDAINLAKAEDIKVFTIGLNLSDYDVLQTMALETGGAVMQADDALQLIALYQSLGELLEGTAYYYQTTWKARKLNGVWSTGQGFSTSIRATLPNGEVVSLPLTVRVN